MLRFQILRFPTLNNKIDLKEININANKLNMNKKLLK